MEPRIVILGAGFAGVRVALDLLKLQNVKITLVNESSYHCYHADLYEVVTTTLKHNDKLSFEHLLGTVDIPLTEIFPHGVELLIDRVEAIDLDQKTIICQKEKKLDYDYLVLALGSSTGYFDIPGAKDFSHPLKTAEDALNIHNDLDELLTQDKVKEIVIAGGGFTGVELAGNLVYFVDGEAKIIIVEGSDHLLGGMPDWAQKRTLKRLNELGVEVKLSSVVSEVKEGQISIKGQEGIKYDYLIWTAGVKGIELPGWIKGVQFSSKETIITQPNLAVPSYPEVFVVGDQASIDGVPQTAWAAIEEGRMVARNISLSLRKKESEDFKLSQVAFDVPIGKGYALSNKYSLRLTGWVGWVIKRIDAFFYFRSILPFTKAIKLWLSGVEIYPQ